MGIQGASPVLKIGSSPGIQIGYVDSSAITSQYIAIQGIRVYSHTRDPNDTAEYVSSAGGNGISDIHVWFGEIRQDDILIEGCACACGLFPYSLRAAGVTFGYRMLFSDEMSSMAIMQ